MQDNISNNIELSAPFIYPIDNDDITEEDTKQQILLAQVQLLSKMASYLLPCKNIQRTMIALFYAAGVDLRLILNIDNNTETAIAQRLGIGKQTFCGIVKTIRKDFNLEYTSTSFPNKNKYTYSNNVRKPIIT